MVGVAEGLKGGPPGLFQGSIRVICEVEITRENG